MVLGKNDDLRSPHPAFVFGPVVGDGGGGGGVEYAQQPRWKTSAERDWIATVSDECSKRFYAKNVVQKKGAVCSSLDSKQEIGVMLSATFGAGFWS
jgi:hypothetical protein